MNRHQAFALLVVLGVIGFVVQGFQSPTGFWSAPSHASIAGKEIDQMLQAIGLVEPPPKAPETVPQAGEIGETILEEVESVEDKDEAEEPTPKGEEEDEPKPEPKPKKAKERKTEEPRLKLDTPLLDEWNTHHAAEFKPHVDREAVDQFFHRKSKELNDCYTYFLDRAGMNVDGVLNLTATVAESGQVTKVDLDNDLGIPRFAACVRVKLTEDDSVSPPPSGGEVVVHQPMVFTRPGAPHYEQYIRKYGTGGP